MVIGADTGLPEKGVLTNTEIQLFSVTAMSGAKKQSIYNYTH
jgi:hypothetical protein